MTFTDEEIWTLRENTKQIEGYLRGLMPRIRESIHIEFGDTVVRRGDYGRRVYEKEFDLWVSADSITGGSSGLRYSFVPGERHSDGWVDLYNSKGYGPKFMAALCGDWQTIKWSIHSAISTQEAKAAKIHSFVL